MKVNVACVCCLLLLSTACGCGGNGGEEPSGRSGADIVEVGGVVLTEHDLANIMPEGERIPFTAEERKLAAQRWVDNEILYQEAVRRGIKKDSRVRARLRGLEQEFLADHLLFLELSERAMVTEEEVEAYFETHRREYVYEYRVSHILVNTPEEAEEVVQQLGKRSFNWIANRYSNDPVARRGGDLGYLTKGNMIPAFEEVVFDMKPGEVSGVIHSDFGYHILKLIGTREALVKVSLDDVREQIMNKLMIEKRARAHEEFIGDLRAAADVEYFKPEYEPRIPAAAPEESLDVQPDTVGGDLFE